MCNQVFYERDLLERAQGGFLGGSTLVKALVIKTCYSPIALSQMNNFASIRVTELVEAESSIDRKGGPGLSTRRFIILDAGCEVLEVGVGRGVRQGCTAFAWAARNQSVCGEGARAVSSVVFGMPGMLWTNAVNAMLTDRFIERAKVLFLTECSAVASVSLHC